MNIYRTGVDITILVYIFAFKKYSKSGRVKVKRKLQRELRVKTIPFRRPFLTFRPIFEKFACLVEEAYISLLEQTNYSNYTVHI